MKNLETAKQLAMQTTKQAVERVMKPVKKRLAVLFSFSFFFSLFLFAVVGIFLAPHFEEKMLLAILGCICLIFSIILFIYICEMIGKTLEASQ